jgi:hypothetical protein
MNDFPLTDLILKVDMEALSLERDSLVRVRSLLNDKADEFGRQGSAFKEQYVNEEAKLVPRSFGGLNTKPPDQTLTFLRP